MSVGEAKDSGSETLEARTPPPPFWKRAGSGVAALVAAGVLAAVTAFGTDLGSKGADGVGASASPPLSYSVEERAAECGSVLFLPEEQSRQVLKKKPPYGISEWDEFFHQPEAAFVGADVVEVSVQGTSTRKGTLTGIAFEVERLKPEQGATFASPCGDGVFGRALIVDLDSTPPDIVASSRIVGEPISVDADGHSTSRPIKFPWTVSLQDPLLLYIIATTDSCNCNWKAEIPWVSGSERGVIRVDDEGSGYRVYGNPPGDAYLNYGTRWRRS